MGVVISPDEANTTSVMPDILQVATELMTNVDVSVALRRIGSIQAGRNITLPSSFEIALVELALTPTR